jgi:hypothetical protein
MSTFNPHQEAVHKAADLAYSLYDIPPFTLLRLNLIPNNSDNEFDCMLSNEHMKAYTQLHWRIRACEIYKLDGRTYKQCFLTDQGINP